MAKCSAKEVAKYFLTSLAELGEKLPSRKTQVRAILADWYDGWKSESDWTNPPLEAVLTAVLKS
jgi:hypothetical protein